MPNFSPTLEAAEVTRDPVWGPPAPHGPSATKSKRGVVATVLRFGVLLYFMLLIVDGALPQLEILVTRGHTPIPMNLYLLLPLAVSVIFIRARVQHNPLLFATIALAGYILLDWIILTATTRYSLNEVRLSLQVYLFAIVVLGLCVSAPIAIRSKYVVTVLMILLGASFCVSMAQFATKDAVVATQSLDNAFSIPSYKFGGEIRAFSLFSSGLHAGIFYCLTAGFGMSMTYTRRRKLLGLLVLAMSAFGCYATLTRLTMIGLVASVTAVVLIHRRSAKKLVPWIPVLWVALAVVVIGKGVYDSGQASGVGISNTSSMEARLLEWRYYIDRFTSGSPVQMIFGQATSQWMDVSAPARPVTSAPISIDNAYLDILLNSGIVGLGLAMFFCWNLWLVLCRKALATSSNLVIACAAVFSVLPFFSSINGFLAEIFLIGVLPLLCSVDAAESSMPARLAQPVQPRTVKSW